MNMFRMAAAALILAASFPASAQTPPAGPGGALSAEEKEKRCQAAPEKCQRMKEDTRMRQAMREACEKDPAACKERHEKALERRRAKAVGPN
jgi:hypothetical protein